MVSISKKRRRRHQNDNTNLIYKSLFLLATACVIWIWKEATYIKDNAELVLMSQQKAPLQNPMNRCIDSDDATRELPQVCKCPDPVKSTARATYEWAVHHRQLAESVTAAAAAQNAQVVFLGDSVTEHWNGTARMGTEALPAAYRQIFEKHFDQSALALGSAGDTTTELLWHLQNGWLDDTLRPDVFVLLIGANDLGRVGCSKRTALAGILNVANYLHEQRPKAQIILHGILPRGGGFGDEDYTPDFTLGEYWLNALWVNRQLQKFCDVHPNEWAYFDVTLEFIDRQPGGKSVAKDLMMPNGRHPNVAGREKWATLLGEKVKERLKVHARAEEAAAARRKKGEKLKEKIREQEEAERLREELARKQKDSHER